MIAIVQRDDAACGSICQHGQGINGAEGRAMALTHMINASPIADRYARGWHCLGLAADYKDGKPHTVNAFGSRLVAYRGEDAQVHVLDSYCPHMGADLSRGLVRGNPVLCP